MKRKVFAALMAGALAMSAVVPATAADGGSVDVKVETKTGVIRVAVPTTLEVAVDQFEKGKAGTQIHSTDFTIENKSDIAVKVSVTSEAKLGSKIGVLASRADVEDSTSKDGELWLAAAAQVADGKYENISNADDLANLDETKDNVTTFAAGTAGTASASQVFYLGKAGDTVAYNMLKPATAGKPSVSYAQFYELTEISSPDQDALDAAIAAGDVYSITTADIADQKALTLIAKGGSATLTTGTTYYTVATTVTEAKNVDPGKVYVYASASGAGTGTKAGFRYVGELSSEKETWSANDFTDVKITYTIDGVAEGRYTDISTDLKYGLLPSKVPVFTADTSTAGLINFTAGLGELALDADADIQVWHEYDGEWYDAAADVTIDKSAKTITYNTRALDLFAAAGNDFKVQITFTCEDGTTAKADVVVKAK